MNTESFEQVAITGDSIGKDTTDFLTENLQVSVLFFNNRPINIELPNFIEDTIDYCEPGVRGNTATGATKPATLTCGATVLVPLFIEQGEAIRVDTRTRAYSSRVKS